MAQSRQNQQRGQQQQGGQRSGARPWNVFYPRTYTVAGNQGQQPEQRTDFMRVGTAFPLTNKQGFSVELQLPLVIAPGERFIIMPRDDDAEQDGRA